ncbi:MAG: glycosyltransferase [Oscillospiraceae bacterium]|nr:glycosyltransferase [Oscillospiraceae bacterium]
MEYKVSVILPAYNAEKTLERAFLSVKNQTMGFENIELLLCDDCSTDGSWAMIRSLAEKYPNVAALRTQKNSGAAGAPRNLGLGAASAPYVMFLDADDVYEPQMVETLYAAMRENGRLDTASVNFRLSDSRKGFFPYKGDAFFSAERFISKDSPFLCAFWAKIYRNDLILKHGLRFYEGVTAEDVVFLQMYLGVCGCGLYIDKPLYIYTEDATSISHCESEFFHVTRGACWAMAIRDRCAWIARYEAQCHITDQCIDALIRNRNLTREQLLRALYGLRPLCVFGEQNDLPLTSAQARILRYDLAFEDEKKTELDFLQLRELHAQQQRELDGIFSSTTWKVASGLQKLLFWRK